MNGNPINRMAAFLGLILLTPIAYGLAMGSLDMVDAAMRAGMTLGGVIVVRIIGRLGLSVLATSMERQPISTEAPQRRATDTA